MSIQIYWKESSVLHFPAFETSGIVVLHHFRLITQSLRMKSHLSSKNYLSKKKCYRLCKADICLLLRMSLEAGEGRERPPCLANYCHAQRPL